MRRRACVLLLLLTFSSPAASETAPSFVSGAGLLAESQHALLMYVDAELLAPPITVGYRHGVLRFLELGLDVGANQGLLQIIAHARVQLLESRTRRFFWGLRLKTGYKTHDFSISDAFLFDDNSWVAAAESAVAVRLGQRRDKAIYITTLFYADVDLRSPQRQTDHYLSPASLGFEALITPRSSFFVQLGLGISLNGTETEKGLLYEGDLFPIGQVGASVRFP